MYSIFYYVISKLVHHLIDLTIKGTYFLVFNKNQEPRGKPTRYELENTFKKLQGKPRGIKPSGGIKIIGISI